MLEGLLRFTVLAISVAALAGSATLFYFERNSGGTVFAGVFIVSLIFVFLARFKKFKGFGIEAGTLGASPSRS
jgi:hypothetical protein